MSSSTTRAAGMPTALRCTAVSPLRLLTEIVPQLMSAASYSLTCERADLVIFLYPGHVDACVLGPIARLRRIPAVLDVFISLYDTVVLDRGLHGRWSPVGIATWLADTLACWSVPLVIVDTPEHADYFVRLTRRCRDRFAVLWVGADETIFVPAADEPRDDGPILWYLTFIPLHGMETVLRAARLLADDNRVFGLIGDGQARQAAEDLARELDCATSSLSPR